MQGWSLVEAKLGSCTPCSVRTGPLTSKTASHGGCHGEDGKGVGEDKQV